nr:hypothetical protein [Tanacetum cinerariifolium]
MKEIVNKFIEEGKREHEDIEAFIREFRTTNKLLFKERSNSLSEIEFKVYGMSRAINKAQIIRCEAKGVTTKDLGASISLIPYTMYEKLGLGKPKPMRMSLELADSLDNSEELVRRITHGDTVYLKTQETQRLGRTQNEHIYSASTNEIDEKKQELKELLPHLEYTYINEDESCPVIISTKLTEKEKTSLLQKSGNISSRNEMPQNNIQVCKVEAQSLPTNDARMVVKFLKGLFARFEEPYGVSKVLGYSVLIPVQLCV